MNLRNQKINKMAIIINTEFAKDLYEIIVQTIKLGYIKTWEIDSEGDLTITHPKWKNKAWFEIKKDEESGIVSFGIIPSLKIEFTNEIYGVFHGRLSSMLLAYFSSFMSSFQITPNLEDGYDHMPLG